ncbi:phage tail sheath subtilisin-like domain-containing protein [Sphingomonas sp. S-NIH.Pt15_0812]|uniref:phage tail sheath subtilisin-like domain-containing protein n=1 Tax=Sphingomonas sp. S-NIH.Pt15_0812 TaxID=1920129 RepID=UPI000F7DC2BD|nr:phage tail sheath subtilisin-like domain-containing protein [Sphingomonas sp. S-NIH.Pt15_0812]RSU46343.1 phage tail protein [Sphingomonas sp. S-NIH.Pt15_0812]
MTIPFRTIPTGLRTPLFYAELDASRANTNQRAQRALLIGQKTNAGTLAPNVPVVLQSESDAVAAGGAGSVLAGMVRAYRQNDAAGEVWALPLADDAAAVAATGSLTFTGPTSGAGVLALYVAGHLLQIPLAAATTAAQVATIVAAAINGATTLPVTATAAAAVVTLTARNRGLLGNDVDLRINHAGPPAGEYTPPGLGVVIAAMTGGATNPSLVTALANLQDTAFDFIVCSLTDATSMAAIAALLSDTTGRWAWSTQVYGHCFIAARGTAGTLAAYASALNNQHICCIGFNDSPSPSWKWAAAFAGAAAVSLRADPGLPLQTLTVAGILAPPLASRFPLTTRNATLLYGGVSTFTVDTAGAIAIENLVTTYVTNAQGQADNSYLEVETLYLLMFVLRRLRDVITAKYSRVKLAADGARLLPGSKVVTPSIIKADLIAAYRQLEAEGMVQNSAAFAAGLVVEKDAATPGRVNVLWPGTLIEQLRIFALLAQFRNA